MAREYIALGKLYGVKQAGISTEETTEPKEARRIGAPFEKADENSSVQQTTPFAEKSAAPKEVQPAEQSETVTHPVQVTEEGILEVCPMGWLQYKCCAVQRGWNLLHHEARYQQNVPEIQHDVFHRRGYLPV